MGTTIRRQPVSFPIPASPEYKFLNITDFGGLNISSNPFVVSSNTASDCLNVYVDEDNALSTRPRVQIKYDLMKLAGLNDDYALIGVYNLHNGYLLHVKKDNKGYMYQFLETNGVLNNPVQITGDEIPTGKCNLFEQNGNIYVLTGNKYKNIIDYVMSDVEGYVPTTTIGKTNTTAGESYESLNLLSDKFKETYFWDGTWSTETLLQYEDDEIDNEYVLNEQVEMYDHNGNLIEEIFILQALRELFKNDEGKKYFLCMLPNYEHEFGSAYVILAFDKFNKMIRSESYGIPFRKMPSYDGNIEKTMVCSANGLTVAYVDWNTDLWQPSKCYYCTRPTINSDFVVQSAGFGPYDETEIGFYPNRSDGKYLKISSDGRVLSWRSSENYVEFYYFDDLSKLSGERGYLSNCVDYDLDVLDDTKYTLVYSTKKDAASPVIDEIFAGFLQKETHSDGDRYLYDNTTKASNAWTDYEKCSEASFKVLPGTSVYFESLKLVDANTNLFARSILSRRSYVSPYDSAKMTISESTTSDKWSGLNMMHDNDLTHIYFQNRAGTISGRFDSETGKDVSANLKIMANVVNSAIVGNIIYSNDLTMTRIRTYTKSSLLFDADSPKLTLIRRVSHLKKENLEEFYKISNTFSSSKLHERFDNNTWFASKNYTFHTLYNDPTYIPLSGYNDLGEDFEEITGLSIVNDNVLAAYKHNRIYIITPVTVGNEETYAYTETKNVVGNDVLDAPILTILTEMPTIVSYDGIFALNQLENVQSSDRITTLISENINPRWLKESSEDIDNCKTLNRLYWTYYILPHKRIGDENKDYTKIYLLDNRTQQWYYWELPIYVINAMVKDNKTHLIHEDGKVFTLETTDLIHEYNPDVTEYYDNVNNEKLIIPWHWTSQILSLNTINYSKKLVDTTFILTDTDTQDEYGLDYSFKAWRKSVSETNATTISNNIHYVQSTTKRTMIPRFNFIQIKLSNTAEDLDNNKLRLVGLGLKYVLLEGLY